ncbi:hypothetical protein ABW20_dc0101990 [Dactylellina cionopaga]|nr:hypothetical protein ABW20_dc0101990 [Dactylellina cionopaga]
MHPQKGPSKSNSKLSSNSKSQKKRKPPTLSKAEKPKVPKLDRPLSELTKDYSNLPIRDMERWVHRGLEERRREVEKRDGHVARPMNSFMLYRSAFAERTKQWCLQNNHQVVSSVSGASWPLEPAWIREKYNEFARIERINHQAAHPGYKFSPSKNLPPPIRRRKHSSDGEDETEAYSSDVGLGDLMHEPLQISQLTLKKKKQRPKTTEFKQSSPLPDEMSTAIISPVASLQEQPLNLSLSLRLQTGAQKSSYEAVNPGRPAPMGMATVEPNGTYYQTIVRPTASANVGNAMVEDVTIRKTAAPATTSSFISKGEESRKQESLQYHLLEQRQQQQRLSQEPIALAKQESSIMEQNFCVYSHEATPDVDFEQYRRLLEQQVMQNMAAQQAYIISHGEILAPYPFVSPGLIYTNTPNGFDLGDSVMTDVANYGDTGGPMWHSLDGSGNVITGDHVNGFQYDEWLAE